MATARLAELLEQAARVATVEPRVAVKQVVVAEEAAAAAEAAEAALAVEPVAHRSLCTTTGLEHLP